MPETESKDPLSSVLAAGQRPSSRPAEGTHPSRRLQPRMACPRPCAFARPPNGGEIEGVLFWSPPGSCVVKAAGQGRLSDLSPASRLDSPPLSARRGRPAPSSPRAAS